MLKKIRNIRLTKSTFVWALSGCFFFLLGTVADIIPNTPTAIEWADNILKSFSARYTSTLTFFSTRHSLPLYGLLFIGTIPALAVVAIHQSARLVANHRKPIHLRYCTNKIGNLVYKWTWRHDEPYVFTALCPNCNAELSRECTVNRATNQNTTFFKCVCCSSKFVQHDIETNPYKECLAQDVEHERFLKTEVKRRIQTGEAIPQTLLDKVIDFFS